VTLYYENTGRLPDPHRVITFYAYDDRPGASGSLQRRGWRFGRRTQRFSFHWWSNWPRLVSWLVTHCTRIEGGELVWAVKTDEKTRRRLEPLAQPHLLARVEGTGTDGDVAGVS
jgi:hypothetical protein